MLEIRPSCENCDKLLPNTSTEAMIYTFECTYCEACVNQILHHVGPNCGGGFEKKPIRPKKMLQKHPGSTIKVHKPVDLNVFCTVLET